MLLRSGGAVNARGPAGQGDLRGPTAYGCICARRKLPIRRDQPDDGGASFDERGIEMDETYTVSLWTARDGQGEAFVDAFRTYAAAATDAGGAHEGMILQDAADPAYTVERPRSAAS